MYFHVCNKNYSASPSQHIFMFLVSFDRQMNKAIYKVVFSQFHVYICFEATLKKNGHFLPATSTLTSMGKWLFSKFPKT